MFQVAIMKLFFEREEKHLDFTTQRMSVRTTEKKEVESAKADPKKVANLIFHTS